MPRKPGGWRPLLARLWSPSPSTFTTTVLSAAAAGSPREGSHCLRCGPKVFLTSQRPLESTPEHTAFFQPAARGAGPTETPPFRAVCECTKVCPVPLPRPLAVMLDGPDPALTPAALCSLLTPNRSCPTACGMGLGARGWTGAAPAPVGQQQLRPCMVGLILSVLVSPGPPSLVLWGTGPSDSRPELESYSKR